MKLHIGGKQVKEGWKILNIQKGEGVDFVGDIGSLEQFAAGSIEEIYASHVLEHVPQQLVARTIAGIHRVLAKGGKFKVSVPDLDILCHAFIRPNTPTQIKFHYMRMMFGGQVDVNDYHYFGWTFEFLGQSLHDAGFVDIQRVESFGLFDDTSDFAPYGFPISLNMVAIK
ncbi:MAG TPA: methyltransferase domain-containing protein [Steroidobacteraceae bacterium]|nr:methyltransferase domain-containing protein [Steroidobacteraceae bacterium]